MAVTSPAMTDNGVPILQRRHGLASKGEANPMAGSERIELSHSMCAEPVRAAARIRRFCGHKFDDAAAKPA
jgi:hypothetical protein